MGTFMSASGQFFMSADTTTNSLQVDIGLVDAADATAKVLTGSQGVVLLGRNPVLCPQVRATDLGRILIQAAGTLVARHA